MPEAKQIPDEIPLQAIDKQPLFGALAGSVLSEIDIVSPIDTDWEVESKGWVKRQRTHQIKRAMRLLTSALPTIMAKTHRN